ncbi:hypothetical protein [Frigoribacterium sp. CFBP9030]|uniref:hypothetical protein n=1 Tax=Frigoribacterium sp. CFBP9030 TaxID=3096537 RepID=UPI002A69EB40|nr:hypothetical protein [Frigoribacterium sp. CFBP9030]MDY0891873.1 hypothetical protein [Frigoribacterium sp. CFBP9030]
MTTSTPRSPFGKLPAHLDPFAPRAYGMPRLRFNNEGGTGEGAGTVTPPPPAGQQTTPPPAGTTPPPADEPLGDTGLRAFERTKEELRDRKGELKAFTDLGLTPDDIKALRDGQNGGQGVDVAGIEQRVRSSLQTQFDEQRAADARASAVRELAATSGFLNPKQALRLVDDAELAKVTVKDGTADEAGVKKLLEALATESPYLVAPTDSTADARTAGIGASGAGVKPESKPGYDRMRDAYADAPGK